MDRFDWPPASVPLTLTWWQKQKSTQRLWFQSSQRFTRTSKRTRSRRSKTKVFCVTNHPFLANGSFTTPPNVISRWCSKQPRTTCWNCVSLCNQVNLHWMLFSCVNCENPIFDVVLKLNGLSSFGLGLNLCLHHFQWSNTVSNVESWCISIDCIY